MNKNYNISPEEYYVWDIIFVAEDSMPGFRSPRYQLGPIFKCILYTYMGNNDNIRKKVQNLNNEILLDVIKNSPYKGVSEAEETVNKSLILFDYKKSRYSDDVPPERFIYDDITKSKIDLC